jgi:hypothetical protein
MGLKMVIKQSDIWVFKDVKTLDLYRFKKSSVSDTFDTRVLVPKQHSIHTD